MNRPASRVTLPGYPERQRLLRFLAVGGASTLAYSLIASALVSFGGFPPWPTAVGLYALFIPLAFLGQRNFTFASKVPYRRGLVSYALVQIASVAATSLATTALVTADPVSNTAVYAATAGVAALVSYVVCRLFVFR